MCIRDRLINDAGTVNVSRAAVDKELQVAMDAGLSFQEAAAQVRNDLPTLTPPKSSSGALGAWVGVASPMASINALITDCLLYTSISQNGQCVALFLRKRHLNPLSSGPCRR